MKKSKIEYLIPIITYSIFFWNNLTSNFFAVDFIPYSIVNFIKSIILSNYSGQNYIFEVFALILSQIDLVHLQFQFSVLIGLFISYYFIHRLTRNNSILFSIIYFYNPFIYSRIITGQLGIVISYLLMPVSIFYILKTLRSKEINKTLLSSVVIISIIGSFSMQFFAFNIMIILLTAVLNKIRVKKLIFFLLIIVLINSFWIQSVFSKPSFKAIDDSHKGFFSPKLTQGFPTIVKIAGMWGFWREPSYITTYKTLPKILWYGVLCTLIILMYIGYYKNPDSKSKLFLALWWIGLVLGTGISHPTTKIIFDFLFEYFPLFNGFRDSHKFVVFIVLSYAYLCPLGLKYLLSKIKKTYMKNGIILVFIILIVLFSYPLLGLWGQVKTTNYPDSYNELNKYLSRQNITGHIIYLPWESYLTYTWTSNTSKDGRISVPINKVIKPLVVLGPDKWGSGQLIHNNIKNCLHAESIQCLRKISVEYIIKDKCAYYPIEYSWLTNKVFENRCIILYRIENSKPKILNNNPPIRFYIGVFVSFLTFMYLLFKKKVY